MKKISKIQLSGRSGYGPEDEAYKDVITITPEAISYRLQFVSDAKENISWRYRSDSKTFADWYEAVCKGVEEQISSDILDAYKDVGGVDFKVIYEDKSRIHKWFCVPTLFFGDLFRLIKRMVPSGETVPYVLMTSEDFKEEYCIELGKYKHFKGKEYEVLGMARNSENEQDMVVYKALYGNRDVWARPAAMWEETVYRNGGVFQRFTRTEGEE